MSSFITIKYLISAILLYRYVLIFCNAQKKRPPPKKLSGKIDRVPPPELYTFPPYKFEGVEYEDDEKSLMGKWDMDPKDKNKTQAVVMYRCTYEYAKCIRAQNFQHWVCTLKYGSKKFYNFLSWCEMEYTNCYLNKTKYYYNGDGLNCNWIYVPSHTG